MGKRNGTGVSKQALSRPPLVYLGYGMYIELIPLCLLSSLTCDIAYCPRNFRKPERSVNLHLPATPRHASLDSLIYISRFLSATAILALHFHFLQLIQSNIETPKTSDLRNGHRSLQFC